MDNQKVYREWFDVCQQLHVDSGIASHWWTLLASHYGEEHRHYHTLQHIEFMLDHLRNWCTERVKNNLEVKLAIYFHE